MVTAKTGSVRLGTVAMSGAHVLVRGIDGMLLYTDE